MKKIVLSVALIGLLIFASCGGESVKTQEAQVVDTLASVGANEFTKIADSSFVSWRASHLAGLQPRWGKVSLKSASISVDGGIITNAKIEMDMASLTVENFEDAESTQKLTGHLKSQDFFKIETYPVATFELTTIESITGSFNSKVSGNLTILDSTKNISFNANIIVSDSLITIQSEDFVVDRKEWGLTYNAKGTKGVPTDYLIADEVGFTIKARLEK